MNRQPIKCIYGQYSRKLIKYLAHESGQALPIVLAVLSLGALVIGPFLSHASTSLARSDDYERIINETYA